MNKKLIINENLNWPLIDENDSKKILEIIESNFKSYQSTMRRKKTPPKYLRVKKDKKECVEPMNLENEEINFEYGILLKQRLRLGINAVTKTLEKEPQVVRFVLVCRSCVPLKLLTRHLHIMCAQLNVPAGCVSNLSKTLAKFLNIKSVSAFALCDESLIKKKETDIKFEKVSNTVSCLVNEISEKIKKYIKTLENPFSSKIGLSKELIDNTQMLKLEELSNESESNTVEIEMTDSKVESSSVTEKNEDFGSDYISFDIKNSNEQISFESKDFIVFNDDYEKIEDIDDVVQILDKKFENRQHHLDPNRKRKLNAPFHKPKNNKNSKNTDNFKFTKLKLVNKKENNKNSKRKNK